MKIRRMTATFGKLDRRTLPLSGGLNILYAPNESGKTTWSVFLRTMLYGLDTRERGPLADKNRYLSWSGTAMEGLMDLEIQNRRITLTRHTGRAPLSEAQAVYTGTAEPVPELAAGSWGEALLGIPREVFERTAFIGQAGLGVSQTPSLERRITTLATAGEEGISFTEAQTTLKKQLSRRTGRTGTLPALEAELSETASLLRQAETQQEEQARLQREIDHLEEQEAYHIQEMHRHASPQLRQQEEARAALRQQEKEVAALPGKTNLLALRAAAFSTAANQTGKNRLTEQLRLRSEESAAAKAPLEGFPLFQGLTGQEAIDRAGTDAGRWQSLQERALLGKRLTIAALPLAVLAAILLFLLPPWPTALLFLLPIALLATGQSFRSAQQQAEELAAAYPDGFSEHAAQYDALYQHWEDTLQAEAESRTRLQELVSSTDAAVDQVLTNVRIFAPEADSLPAAVTAIDDAIEQLDRLDAARTAYDQLCAAPSLDDSPHTTALAETRTALAGCRQRLAQLQTDPSQLSARLETLTAQKQEVLIECEALSLALATLENANASIQAKFSPALGAETTQLFSRLTGGRYRKVLLDRDLTAQAEAVSDMLPHAASLLSRGAADQLYLALRLALCRLVLPAPAPLILDDALSSFDDDRLTLALEVLFEEAKNRQILLFTCQSREVRWARNHVNVHIATL